MILSLDWVAATWAYAFDFGPLFDAVFMEFVEAWQNFQDLFSFVIVLANRTTLILIFKVISMLLFVFFRLVFHFILRLWKLFKNISCDWFGILLSSVKLNKLLLNKFTII